MYSDKEIKLAWKKANDFGIRYFGDVGHNAKSIKSDTKTEYLTYMIYLAPSNQAGAKYNVCASASKGCREACLYTAGRGACGPTQAARKKRTKFFFEHRDDFKRCVYSEIDKHATKCAKKGVKAAVRLNGTSDIIYEVIWPDIFKLFDDITFYDYTKHVRRMMSDWKLPKNYHLTFSRSEENNNDVLKIIEDNPRANIAVVFDEIPEEYLGREVINGDYYDARFLDPEGVIVGLKMKGRGSRDKTGFVVHKNELTIKGRKLETV